MDTDLVPPRMDTDHTDLISPRMHTDYTDLIPPRMYTDHTDLISPLMHAVFQGSYAVTAGLALALRSRGYL